jgi:hypothetical protein
MTTSKFRFYLQNRLTQNKSNRRSTVQWYFPFNSVPWFKLTRHDVAEADGGHGDEAEVEGVEEAPVLPEINVIKLFWASFNQLRH